MESPVFLPKDIENLFSYHAPTAEQVVKYQRLRDKAKELAYLIVETVPVCADQSAAIRHLRECIMTANAGIACNTPVPQPWKQTPSCSETCEPEVAAVTA